MLYKLVILFRTKIVSFNVRNVNIFWAARTGSQRQSHKRLINITALLWFLFSKLRQNLLKTPSCALPHISSGFANSSLMPGGVGRTEGASSMRSRGGAGASCPCAFLSILAVAFLRIYNFAESPNLLCFFRLWTSSWWPVWLCGTRWAEQRPDAGMDLRCRGYCRAGLRHTPVLDRVPGSSECYSGSSGVWKFGSAALFPVRMVMGMQRHRLKMNRWCMYVCM